MMSVPLQRDIDWLEHHGVKGQKWGVRRAQRHKQSGVEKAVNRKLRKAGNAHRERKAGRAARKAPKPPSKYTKAQKVEIGLNVAAIALIGAAFVAKSQKNKSISAAKASSYSSHGKDWINAFQGTPAAMKPFIVSSGGVITR